MTLSDWGAVWLQEEDTGGEQDSLDLYQHSLEELLLLLAGEAGSSLPPPLQLCLALTSYRPALNS